MQTSLLGLAFGLILAFLAALIGPGLVDWNARKPWIEAEASRLFAMPVKLSGPVTLRLLPIPTLDLQGVTLGDGAQSITIGTLFGELRLAPLLRGQIIMERTAFSRPVLRLTLPVAKDAMSLLPNIDDLGIEEGTLVLVDAKGNETRLENLNLLGESHASGLKLAGKSSLAGKPATISLIYTAPTPQDKGRVRLRLERQEAIVEADGLWDGSLDLPFDGQFSLNMPTPVGRLHWRAPLAASPLRSVLGAGEGELRQDAQALRFSAEGQLDHGSETFALSIQARAADADMLAGAVSAPDQLRTVATALNSMASAIALPRKGDIHVQVSQLRLGGANYDRFALHLAREEGAWRLADLQSRLPGDGQIRFTGRAGAAALSGQVQLDVARPQALVQALGDRRTRGTAMLDPLSFQGQLEMQGSQLRLLETAITSASGAMAGQIQLDMGTQPLWRVDLAAQSLDLDRLATTLSGFEALTRTRLDVTLLAREARYRELTVGDLRLSALQQDQSLTLRHLTFSSAEGEASLAGSAVLAPTLKGQFDGQLRLQGAVGPWRKGLVAALQLPPKAQEFAALAGDLILAGRVSLAGDALTLQAEGLLGDGPVRLMSEQGLTGALRRSEISWTRPDLGATLALLTGQTTPSYGPPAMLTLVTTRKSAEQQELRLTLKHPTLDLQLQGEGDARGLRTGSLLVHSEDLGKASQALGYLAEEAPGALPLDWQGTWRILPQGFELTGRGQFDRQPLTLTLSGGDASLVATLRASTLDATVLGSFLMAPALRQSGVQAVTLDLGVEALSLFGEPVRDLSLLVSGPVERRQIALRAMRLSNGERVTGEVQLTPLASQVAVSGELSLTAGRIAAFWPGATGELTATASFGGQGSDLRGLSSSLLGIVSVTGKGWTVPGLNPNAFERAKRAAEETQDLGKPMDEGRLSRIFREEAARPVTLGDLEVKGSINAGLLRFSLPVVAVQGGSLTGQAVLDPSGGNLRFEGAILPEGNGAVLPRIPATLDMADNLFRSQYGLDDLIGWVTLHLLDREEERLGMAEADRLERLRQRLRLDKQVRPRSPVRSPERFIPPRL